MQLTEDELKTRRDELWTHALTVFDEIQKSHKPYYGGTRGYGFYTTHADRLAVVMTVYQKNGTTEVNNIEVWKHRGELAHSIKKSWHSSEDFWNEQAADRSNSIIIDHMHYRLGKKYPAKGDGFGGSHFKIKMKKTGEIIETRDLWHQGTIPPKFRRKLKDNAEFIK